MVAVLIAWAISIVLVRERQYNASASHVLEVDTNLGTRY